MKIQITISDLEALIQRAKKMQKYNSSLSSTIEFSLVSASDTHLGSDRFKAELKSGYAECVNTSIN